MFMVVVTLFVICWLPYHGFFVYQFINDQVVSYKHIRHIYLSFYWLAMSNTMINPLVYYYMNTRWLNDPTRRLMPKFPFLRLWLFVLIFGLRFREHFRTVLCCWKRPLSTSATSPMRGALVMRQLRNDRADFVPGQSLLLVTLDPFSTSTST